MRALVLFGLSVLSFPVLGQETRLSVEEIRKTVVNKTVYVSAYASRIVYNYKPDGRFSAVWGRDGGTQTYQGVYEVTDGKICHKSDTTAGASPRISEGCYAVLREGTRLFYLSDRNERRRAEIF
jgi:hypothetical protein